MSRNVNFSDLSNFGFDIEEQSMNSPIQMRYLHKFLVQFEQIEERNIQIIPNVKDI